MVCQDQHSENCLGIISTTNSKEQTLGNTHQALGVLGHLGSLAAAGESPSLAAAPLTRAALWLQGPQWLRHRAGENQINSITTAASKIPHSALVFTHQGRV